MLNLATPRRAVLSGIVGFLAAFGVMTLLPEGWLAPLEGSRVAIMTLLADAGRVVDGRHRSRGGHA